MKGQDVIFERGLNATDGIHPQVEFNEYRRTDMRWVTIGQLVIGTLFAVVLMALYVGFAWLEG